ncbi:MAG: LLM class flavin-dependent oxidoreductase [Nitrososphaeraceae archaeon]|jgi:5,10-methylenetetrahydromethanopterin reductase|nr:LLM class flavin-dependent oxidoreductase [Nitrososphaeraceae archaeon]MDW0136600.1 LLM class flavin-dependent oxidoreductase [Nitrososphaeraceae archaeon]MDW0138201.1 LLM class flavin-dependent oxidoreductase [Nitrososphaeraceae archaeon]MDW0142082.1 LLM class flavin-dependent oxidoreductase [Nitrososphaeraceae archaeon]MDW0144500.1 LLM class flavin-dependent oxidoreductase [Nitrososphaeraceae archaeon]
MTDEIGQIGYNPSSLFNTQDILEFAKQLDFKPQVNSIWIPESWGREAFVMLGAIGAITRRIKLGTSIVSMFSRPPATLAMAASTLDNISLNRTIIGIGASTPILAENWHGIKFVHPLKRMREYVTCFKIISSGETINFDGNFFKLKNIKIMHPSQRKEIPVFLGAVNSGMIKLATEVADGTILYLRPLDELKKTVDRIKSLTSRKSKSFEICSVFITAVSNKYPDLARERAAKTLAFYVAVGKYYNEFLSSHGFENQVEQITTEYQNHGVENISKFVTDPMLDSLTIYGTTEDCIKSLKRFVSCGVSLPILQVNPVKDNTESISDSLLLVENV